MSVSLVFSKAGRSWKGEPSRSEVQPEQQLVQMIVSSWISRAIYVAVRPQIADLLADGPFTAEELAAAAGVAPWPKS
jgi:hypothetical protein